MITGRNIIVLSSTAWDLLWEGNHEIATRLARAGNRVFYIEHMGFRAPGLRKMRRVGSYAARWVHHARTLGVREVERDLYVCTPAVLPPYGSRFQRFLNRRIFLPLLDIVRRRLDFRDPIIINYVPTDTAATLISMFRSARSTLVAYYADDYARIIGVARLRESEEVLLRQSELVLAQEASLASHCRMTHDNVHLVTHGVDLQAFAMEAGVAPELSLLPRPIIGYVGGLHAAVDYALVEAMARRRPDWSWVFVGPNRDAGERLPREPNVHALGWRPHGELNQYMRSFDVCMIPYLEGEATRAVFPTKLYEYLAAGRPVVCTRLPAVVALHEREPVFQLAAADPDQFLAAIETALRDSWDAAAMQRRRTVAAQNDWVARMEEISSLIEAAVHRG